MCWPFVAAIAAVVWAGDKVVKAVDEDRASKQSECNGAHSPGTRCTWCGHEEPLET